MNRRAIFISTLSLLLAISVALFPLKIKAEWNQTGTGTIYYTQTKYSIPLNYDINGLVETTNFSSLTSNEYQGLSTSSTLNNNIDNNYDLFVMANSNYYVSADSLYSSGNRNWACLNFNNLSTATSNMQWNSSAQVKNIINGIANIVIGGQLDISAVSFGTLYNLGYRFVDVKYITDLSTYVYILAKYRTPEITNYSGTTTTANSADQKTLYIERYDINLDSFYYNYTGDWDYIQVVFISGCDLVYDSNDVNIYYSTYDSSTGDYYYVVNIAN